MCTLASQIARFKLYFQYQKSPFRLDNFPSSFMTIILKQKVVETDMELRWSGGGGDVSSVF